MLRRSNTVKLTHQTTPRSYAAWWLGLLFLHCVSLCYYVGASTLYTSFDLSYTYKSIGLLTIGIANTEYTKISNIHLTIAAVHAAYVLLMIGTSIHARKLAFQPNFGRIFHTMTANPRASCFVKSVVAPLSSLHSKFTQSSAIAISGHVVSSQSISRVTDSFVASGTFLFSREGILGVDSVYFDHILLLREIIETGLQTFQVFRMSNLLPRLWLIRFYVALLVANCWVVPLLHRYYRDRETTRRMLCLLCDIVLDTVSSIGVSLIIFATYAPQYSDPTGFGFPYPNWFDDQWLANMQHEFEIMLVTSWGDMISRVVLALGVLLCTDAIKDMLTPVPTLPPATQVAGQKNVTTPSAAQPEGPRLRNLVAPLSAKHVNQSAMRDEPSIVEEKSRGAEVKAVVESLGVKTPVDALPNTIEDASCIRAPEITNMATLRLNTAGSNVLGGLEARISPVSQWTAQDKRPPSRRRRIVHFLVHIVGPGAFVVWGFVILVVHLIAESHTSNAPCELRLKPWLGNKPGCSIIEINCHRIQSSGQDQAIAAALENFDPERAARVTFRHCPALVITPKFREFKNMAGLKIYNSTVVSWDDNAALTSSDHPAARAVFLVRTYFPNGELPQGLLSNDFPPLVSDITTCMTNLRVLPDDLDKKWAHGLYIGLEYAEFTSIPAVVLRLHPTLMSVAGSPVASAPAELFEIQNLECVLLGYTRVQELPRNVTRVSPRLLLVFAHQTNVTTFWSWMEGVLHFQTLVPNRLFNAYDTPYCREREQIEAGTRSGFSSTPSSDWASVMDVSTPQKLAFARRVVDCTPAIPSRFPLALEDAIHRLR